MVLLGALLAFALIGIIMLAVYAKTMTDDNQRLRALLANGADLADAIFNPDDVEEYKADAALVEKDKVALINALRDPDGAQADELAP